MASVAYRATCYAAFASVAIENAPSHCRTLAKKVGELFNIYFESFALNAYLRVGEGKLVYNAIKPTEADRFYSFYLKPEFYACLQGAIIQDTGKQPAEGVEWLAEQYLECRKPVHTPTKVFEVAIKKFENKNAEPSHNN